MNDYAALIAGILCAGAGGELFLRGIVGLAQWARISAGIIGATVAAFATSSPELSVAISAALAGTPEISLGDALGSNVVNVALILGLTLLISASRCPRDSLKRDFPVALAAPLLVGILAFDGMLSRLDGALLLFAFLLWCVTIVIEARRQRNAAGKVLGEHRLGLATLQCTIGLALLVLAGKLVVSGARGLAVSFGIDEFVIGATLVAIGTSAPELATSLIAKMRGHDEVGLGTLLGSNIFNGLFIIGIAALISPIPVHWPAIATALAFGVAALLAALPNQRSLIGRWRGVPLLAIYSGYAAVILW